MRQSDNARLLALRIAQHEHWCRAPAVREGLQPSVDPDAAELVDMADDVRTYAREAGGQLIKHLSEGRWKDEYVSDAGRNGH